MTSSRKRDLLFHIENEVQFDSLKPLLEHIRDKTNITFDIVVPDDISETTIVNKEVHDGGVKSLRRCGFSVIRGVDGVVLPDKVLNTKYKVFLSAYMYRWHYEHIQTKYRIMFPYASYYLNKPQWTIDMFIERDYMADALISHAIGTKEVTDIFTKTYIVPSLKLMGYKKNSKKHYKPVLFFAPTYNEIDFATKFLQNIEEIKKKYTIAMRGHHRIIHIEDNKDIASKLYEKADKIYDMNEYSLVDALSEADVVVSDNSAIIFDAIYCEIPVALFSSDPNSLRYKDINTIQGKLVKSGDILWTSDPSKVCSIVDRTLSSQILKRQKKIQEDLFPARHDKNPVGKWMEVLQIYINDEMPEEYHLAKRYMIENKLSLEDGRTDMQRHINNLDAQLQQKDHVIQESFNPGIKISLKLLIKAIMQKTYTRPKTVLKYYTRPVYRKIKIKFFDTPVVIYQFIFTVPEKSINFGDELTKDIVERFFHKKTEVHNCIDTRFDMIGVGSLIHFFNDKLDYKTYVWGSGLIDNETKDINGNFIFKSVRGKTTRSMLPKKYQNIPVGDPGLLCNLIYTNKVEKTDKIGVIPHFRDEHSHYLNDVIKKHPEIFKIISVGQSPEKVADEIKACKLILSSPLHGLIVADSFGVPNMHLVLSDNLQSPNHLRGGEYKFRDYYSGVNRKYKNFNPRNKDLLDLEAYEKIIDQYNPIKDLDKIQRTLIKAFPYR